MVVNSISTQTANEQTCFTGGFCIGWCNAYKKKEVALAKSRGRSISALSRHLQLDKMHKGMVRVGAGLPGLLKDGYKHMSGLEEAILRNIDAAKKLSTITRTSLGPNGMNKLVINHLEKLFVTSDAAVICRELEVIHPAANLVVMAAKMQEDEMGDGTNFTVTLVGELLSNAEKLLRMGLHISEIVTGFEKALKKTTLFLEELATEKVGDYRNIAEVTRVIKPVIGSKQSGTEELLAPLIAEACLSVMPPAGMGSFNVDNVRVCKLKGGHIADSKVVFGVVCQRDTCGTIKKVTDAKVAVFSSAIQATETEAKGTVLITSADELMNYSKSEESLMEKAIREIADSGVKVVISGGSISEMAAHFLEKFGIMSIKIMSKFELRRMCRATGATAMPKLGAPTPEEMGHVDCAEVLEFGESKVTVFRQTDDSSRVATIILRSSTQNSLDDLQRAIDDGVATVKVLQQDSRLVPGAGATEIELARKIAEYALTVPGLDQYAVKKFAEALEVVPRTLAENSGQQAQDVVSALYTAHANEGSSSIGVDVINGGVLDAKEHEIMDLYKTKQSAFELALEAALTILRVDQIIMSKRAGGPKPKGNVASQYQP